MAFYLAQTLHTINMLPEALDAYEDRVQMGGWYEEVFESLLRKVLVPLAPHGSKLHDLAGNSTMLVLSNSSAANPKVLILTCMYHMVQKWILSDSAFAADEGHDSYMAS